MPNEAINGENCLISRMALAITKLLMSPTKQMT